MRLKQDITGSKRVQRRIGAEPLLDELVKSALRSANDDETEKIVESLCRSSVKIETKNSEGSGVIIHSDDTQTLILTNKHVIDPAYKSKRSKTMEIKNDGRTIKPQRLLIAPHGLDLAVVEAGGDFGPAVRISFNKPRLGAKVIVVGAGLGFENTVSMGIVAKHLEEKTRDGFLYDVIHTDAQVNLGNSGGGIFRFSSGELIGVITYKLVTENKQLAEGGFAISINMLGKMPIDQWKALKLG